MTCFFIRTLKATRCIEYAGQDTGTVDGGLGMALTLTFGLQGKASGQNEGEMLPCQACPALALRASQLVVFVVHLFWPASRKAPSLSLDIGMALVTTHGSYTSFTLSNLQLKKTYTAGRHNRGLLHFSKKRNWQHGCRDTTE